MNDDSRTLVADAQFLLAQVLWDPREDRERAIQLAELAARSHPDPATRAVIARWINYRTARSGSAGPRSAGEAEMIDGVAVEHVRDNVRANALVDRRFRVAR
ncbi:MAG TPA: hypothetical protein VLX92_08485 [Kofleriaceae bacterium]|nr:hypothetical protein [Kofleriaceae bacterium]